jgi:hypothetical protein
MNRTLLLFIVDFLFLNLIALTRWERVEPTRPVHPPVPAVGANAATQEQDLVETMRQSLADEQAAREALEGKLAGAGQTLAEREQNLAVLQAEREKLSAALSETRRGAEELGREAEAAQQVSAATRDQLDQLRRELDEKTAEAERQRERIAGLERDQSQAQKKIDGLTMAVVVGEAEKEHLEQQADQLQAQVRTEREERLKVQDSNRQLAHGVGELAQTSGELTREIRENRPINANVLFSDFLAHRVGTTFAATRRGLFGRVVKRKETPTVFTTDGRKIYALLHIGDTMFSAAGANYDWSDLSVTFTRPPDFHTAAGAIEFLAPDPRVVAVPVDASQVAALGAKVYPLAADPFKFPDAVLVSGDKGYGEVGFKLDPSQPDYVRVDNRLFKRLFGDFAPSRGDLVFSHTGELLGVMVNNDYCALVKDFTLSATLPTGAGAVPQASAQWLDALAARVQALPPELQ